MMRLTYPICCGLDVHKNVIVATIVTTDSNGISEYYQKSFSTINSDIQRFHNWLIENDCYHVCMESTGKYWIPIFNYLENDINVCLTHPKYVKAIKGKKTDKKDSKWIADFIQVNQEKCTKCGICVDICPPRILKIGENGPGAVEPDACIACGHCVSICPNTAIDNVKAPLSDQVALEKFPVIDSDTAYNFIRSRRSIRCYKSESIPKKQLLKLIDIARFAPTASNKQGISYIIVDNKKILEKATEIVIQWMEKNQSHWWSFPLHIHAYREQGIDGIFHSAHNLIIATAPKDFKNGRENTLLSFAYLELYANTLGIGSAWAGLFEMCAFSNYSPLLDLFKIPENKSITGAVMVGFPKYRFKRLVDRNPLDVTWCE